MSITPELSPVERATVDRFGIHAEVRDEAEAAFPYTLADNERNRIAFASGYRAGAKAQQQRILEAVGLAQEANDDCRKWQQLVAARDAVIERVRAAVDGPHPANSGLDSFTLAHVSVVLDAAPESVLAEHDARVLEDIADQMDAEQQYEHADWLRQRAAEYRKAGQR